MRDRRWRRWHGGVGLWHERGRGQASGLGDGVVGSGSGSGGFSLSLDLLCLLTFELLDSAPSVVAAFVPGERAGASCAATGGSSLSPAICGGFFFSQSPERDVAAVVVHLHFHRYGRRIDVLVVMSAAAVRTLSGIGAC